jgi:hypothetical protein
LLGVLDRVVLSGLAGVVRRVELVPMRDVCMVSRLFVIADLVMLRGFPMMVRGLLVMRGGLAMMVRPLVRCHTTSPCES